MKRNKIFFLLLLIFSSRLGVAQENKEIDSLKALLSKAKEDSLKVNTLIELSKLYVYDPDTSIIYADKAIELSEKLGYRRGLAQAWKYSGLGRFNQGDFLGTVQYYERSLAMFDSIGDKVGLASMYSNMGNIYFNQGDDVKATEWYFKSLKMAEAISDSSRIITMLNNIGAVYMNKESNYDKALQNLWMAYPLSMALTGGKAKNKEDLVGATTVNLGEVYLKKYDIDTTELLRKRDIDSALIYFDKSIKAYSANSENLTYSLNDMGAAYMKIKEFDKAIQYQTRAFELAKKLDAKYDMAVSLVGLAQTHYAKGDTKIALEKFLQAESIAKETGANRELKDSYDGLHKSYAMLGDFRKAYYAAISLIDTKDKLDSITSSKKLGTLQFAYDLSKKQAQLDLKELDLKKQRVIKNITFGGLTVVMLFLVLVFFQKKRITKEKKRSDELLLNILPEETAEELKATGTAKAKSFDLVTVMFTDFKNFTQASELLSAEELVHEINYCYSEFDKIITKYGIEKIKTIGDAYMCAGGLPVTNSTHPDDVIRAGLEFQDFIAKNKKEREQKGQPFFELRLGIHTGPVVAGIVGIKKFAYDIWGDTVNTASRMESSGEIGKVNISGTTYELVKDKFECTHRGKVKAKNKGEIDMYFVEKSL